ncbi:GntR family transcriptional regulator [Ancylobacter sp.]|uniref:GntR family transcriptional regulator n=1 Tax=Ancylobacter sp. TaxID=1872567 RepID=UPI003BAA6D39
MLVTVPETEKPAARWQGVYAALREAIIGRKLAPGTKLPEDALAAIYAVSRTVVRAALQALSHDRLVRLEPNRGAFVASPSTKEAREVFEARGLIEPQLAALAARTATPADIAHLRAHLAREREALATDANAAEAIALSAHFHVEIAEIAGHSIFTGFVRDLVSHSSLIIALYWTQRETTCKCEAHKELVDAIAEGEPLKAAAIMREHITELLLGLDLARKDSPATSLQDLLK